MNNLEPSALIMDKYCFHSSFIDHIQFTLKHFTSLIKKNRTLCNIHYAVLKIE